MPDTFEALGVFLVAVLPGANYVWSFECMVGRWGLRVLVATRGGGADEVEA